MPEPLVSREEARATLEARRELGPELDEQLVDSFVERIERRLEERTRAAPPVRSGDNTGAVVVAVMSLMFAIPLIAIASGTGGGLAVVAVCALLIAVNAMYHQNRR